MNTKKQRRMHITRIHYFSGLTITIFIVCHLFNHFTSVYGAEVHIEIMENLRLVYRNIIAESILIIAVFVQIVSGIKLFFSKRKNKTNFYGKLQVWSGLYLAFFLIIHVGAIQVGRHILNLDTNFYFGVAGLNTFPLSLFFIPYYGLAIIAFFGHVSAIHYQKMKKKILGLSVEQQSKFILTIGIVITAIIFYGLTNGFTGVKIPEEYNIMIGK